MRWGASHCERRFGLLALWFGEGCGRGGSPRLFFIICDIFTAGRHRCAAVLPGAGDGSGVAVFDRSRCTGYKIKVSFGCTGFLALISGNIFVLFTYFSAGQDLGALCVWLQPVNYEGIG